MGRGVTSRSDDTKSDIFFAKKKKHKCCIDNPYFEMMARSNCFVFVSTHVLCMMSTSLNAYFLLLLD